MMDERVIRIRAEAFGCAYDVQVIPPVEGEALDADFCTYKEARGWAGGLRMTRGWRVVDETEAAHG